MKTSPECIPCFKRQIAHCSKIASPSPKTQSEICLHVEKLLEDFDFSLSPPVNAMQIYSSIAEMANNPDPYEHLKAQSTEHTLSMRKELSATIQSSDDPLYTAALFALAGNIIDYGSQQHFDLAEALKKIMIQPPVINHFDQLRRELSTCKSVLYLGDNCGEIIFDGLFIEQMACPTYLSLKEGPIINDATVADGYRSGLDTICPIISNGTSCPGTPVEQCSTDFKKKFHEADLIISKGQGNFETLSEVDRTIYFLLTIKCDVVAEHVKEIANWNKNIAVSDSVILKKE